MSKTSILLLHTLILINASQTFAQLSETIDCTKEFELSGLEENMTAAERIVALDERFYEELYEKDLCQKKIEGNGASASTSAGDSAVSRPNSGKSIDTLELSSELDSKPTLENSEVQNSSTWVEGSYQDTAGAKHQELDSTNNREILRSEIIAQAKEEKDPVVKKKLLEKAEQLK